MSTDTIELTYQVTPEATRDALMWRRYRPQPLRQRVAIGAVGLVVGVALATIYSLVIGQALDLASYALGFLTAIFFLGLFWRAALRRRLQEHLDRSPAEVTARFDTEGISLSSQSNRMFARWASVSDIIAGQGGTILRVGTTVFAVPHAALDNLSPEQFGHALLAFRKAAA